MTETAAAHRRARRTWTASAFAVCLLALLHPRTGGAEPSERLTRDRLAGVWRLVRIEYSDAHGSNADPFYQPGSTGLLIYDPSGWMSVRISAPHRPAFEVPDRRPADGGEEALDRSKLFAFDSYYAYDGTWELDPGTAVLTHHVLSSLLPAENGMSYTQHVSLEGRYLIFSNRSGASGAQTVRRKIWERADGH